MIDKKRIAKAACGLTLALAVAGCNGRANGDDKHGHDHDDPAPKTTATTTKAAPAAADAHDEHGQEHGAKEPGGEAHGAHDGHADEVKLAPDAIKASGIRVEPVSRRALAPTLTFPARVAFNADAVAHVGSQVKGRVVEVRALVGASVRRGDELLIVESPEYAEAQGDYLQKRVGAVAAQAAVDAAKVSYGRAKALQEKNQGIALAEVQKREAEWRAAQAAARTAEAALLSAQSKLKLSGWDEQRLNALMESGGIEPRLPIHAPISGKVVEREVTLGELVTPERDALLVLADVDRLWVLADVPETRLSEVAEGAPARVHVAAVRGQVFEGRVSQVAPTLNAETRTAAVRIEVPNTDGKLRPGMFASAELSTAAPGGAAGEAVLAIPDEAVQTVEGRAAVFVPVEGEANTFAARPVTLGKAIGAMVPVLSGLKEGERVVTAGSFVLKAELGKGEAGHDHGH